MTLYTVYLKNGQRISLKGARSNREKSDNTFEIFRDENKKEIAARFELLEVAGVVFEKTTEN